MFDYSIVTDKKLRSELARKGFALLPQSLPPNDLAKAMKVYTEYAKPLLANQSGNTVACGLQSMKNQIYDALLPVLQPWLAQFFNTYKMPLVAFYTKGANVQEIGSLHQDPTIAPLPFASLSVWMPLLDVDAESGTLSFVPYSHRIFSGLQDKTTPLPFGGDLSFFKNYLVPVCLKAGQAVVFHNNVLHTSTPNCTELVRVAIGCKIMTKRAPLTTVFSDGSRAYLLQQPDNFYLHELWNDSFDPPLTTDDQKDFALTRAFVSPWYFRLKYAVLRLGHLF